jgi:hypothetical protein
MSDARCAIDVAGDRQIADYVLSAQRRLVALAPAVTRLVAEAICDRWRYLGPELVSVILDIDPEVYRLGYGEAVALELLVETAASVNAVIRRQPGIRIGVIIADDRTLVYSPTPQLIEAGPNTAGAANAIYLGPVPLSLVSDLAPETGDARVGATPMAPAEIQKIRQDLTENPPQKFDIARRMNVFNSYFEFVELELAGVHIDRKRIQIPALLMGVADEKTREQIRSQFQIVPPDSILSGETLRRDRDLLVRRFMKVIPNYGSVVRRAEKDELIKEVEKLRESVVAFRNKVGVELQKSMDKSRQELVKALLPGVQRNPPKEWRFSDGRKPDKDACRIYIEQELEKAFGTAQRLLGGMEVGLQFKGVTYETLKEEGFLAAAAKAGLDVNRLHEEFEAAKATSTDVKRPT